MPDMETSQELTPEAQLDALEHWHASLRRSFNAQGENIAQALERLAAQTRQLTSSSRTLVSGLEDRPERFTGIASEVTHDILWGLANLHLDHLTSKAGEIETTAADIRRLRKELQP